MLTIPLAHAACLEPRRALGAVCLHGKHADSLPAKPPPPKAFCRAESARGTCSPSASPPGGMGFCSLSGNSRRRCREGPLSRFHFCALGALCGDLGAICHFAVVWMWVGAAWGRGLECSIYWGENPGPCCLFLPDALFGKLPSHGWGGVTTADQAAVTWPRNTDPGLKRAWDG